MIKLKKDASYIQGLIIFLMAVLGFNVRINSQPSSQEFDLLQNTSELANYMGKAKLLYVTNSESGGFFYLSHEKHEVDDGIVFSANDKNSCWLRHYDQANGVNIAWFGAKQDSVTDDSEPLIRALKYALVKITGNIAITGKMLIPEGHTIEVSTTGSITIKDTFQLQIKAFFKANDYQNVFKGTQCVKFGSISVPYVSPCWFGAVANATGEAGVGKDNTESIKMALKAAEDVSEIYLPPTPSNRFYRTTGTITISKNQHFFSFRFKGGGTTITHKPSDRATTIFADFLEGAAINVQGCRRTYISDLCIFGRNNKADYIANPDYNYSSTDIVYQPDSFLSAGIKSSYSAITTDGEKENKVWSADIVFNNLLIERFCLGIGISQGGNVQGDRMRVENCQINYCVYGISIGNHQNRSCHFINLDMNRVWCGITNTIYGYKGGSLFQVTGGQWCNLFKCFHIVPSFIGQCVISGLYTEAIGCLATTPNIHDNNSSLLFTGCNFAFQDAGIKGNNFKTPFYNFIASGNATFEGCNFWAAKRYLAMAAVSATKNYTGASIAMKGCSILNCESIFIKGNSTVENTYLVPNSESIDYNRSITIDFRKTKRYNTGYSPQTAISGTETENADENKITGTAQIVRKIPHIYSTVDITNKIKIMKSIKDTIQFSYTDELYKSFFRYVLPGDFLGTNISPLIFSTTSDNPTMVVLNIDKINKQVTAQIRTTDIAYNKLSLFANSFFTTQPVTGVVTNGSDRITNIQNIQLLNNGDFITFDAAKKAYRIQNLNIKDSTAHLFDPVNLPVNGRTTLYNEKFVLNDSINR